MIALRAGFCARGLAVGKINMQGQTLPEFSPIKGQAIADDPAPRRPEEGGRRKPIFVYSGFRTSSTWLWGKFRAHASLMCYYEPFNEQLGSLTLDSIGESRPDNWRSHHPSGAPYVLEYAGMLGEGVGVPGFPAARDLGERYIGAAGAEGPLDEDVAAYVQGLINHAHQRDKVPLLACTRLLGRAHGLKAAFGGYHILLVRNLFHQWNSYAGQARFGNWYFFQTLYETLGLATRDPVIARLTGFFPEETKANLETWVASGNFDKVFCYFVGFHLYFLTLTRRSADLVVHANALAGPDPRYRHEIVATIATHVGIELDLEDVSERVDFPLYPVADREACVILIDEIAAEIKSLCGADTGEQAFIDELVADVWSEEAMFRRHTTGALEYVAQIEAQLDDVSQKADQGAQEAAQAREALDAMQREIEELRGEWSSEVEDLQARLGEREALLKTMQAEWETHAHRSEAALRETDKNAEALAAAHERLAEADNTVAQAHETLMSVRNELEAERVRNMRHEAEVATARAQAGTLQVALAEARRDEADLRTRLSQLEHGIANVDAANIDLVNRLLQAERNGQKLVGKV